MTWLKDGAVVNNALVPFVVVKSPTSNVYTFSKWGDSTGFYVYDTSSAIMASPTFFSNADASLAYFNGAFQSSFYVDHDEERAVVIYANELAD